MNWLLIGGNLWGFFFELSLSPRDLDSFLFTYSFIPARLWSGQYSLSASFVTILVAMFLHAGWLHIGGNMLFLYIFGDNVEDRLGHFRYLVFYLLCGVSASLCHAYFNPSSRIPSLGASGAISGVLAAYLFLYPRARILTLVPLFLFFTTEIPAFVFIVFWFVVQFFSGEASLRMSTPTSGGTAYFAHIGGFIAGIVLLALLKPRRPVARYVPG
jgi:membrane associated rhomboid family serine protease